MARFQMSACPAHAQEMASLLSRRLGASIRHIAEQSEGHVELSGPPLFALIERLEAGGWANPECFALHHDMVAAIESDDLIELQTLFGEIADLSQNHGTMVFRRFSVDGLGERKMQRYARHAGDDPARPVRFAPPDDRTFAAYKDGATAALQLLATCAPDHARQIESLVSEIVVADPDQSAGGAGYGSISAFPLWGAVFVNPRLPGCTLDHVEVLAHESMHLLLFAHSVDEPLVLNAASEVFQSPLREDPRPMDGIVHAACVIAYLHNVLTSCVESGHLDPDDREDALGRINDRAAECGGALDVIRNHARLTETGEMVVAAIERYLVSAGSRPAA